MNTPWGQSQQIEIVADGIVKVSTASHGGYHLDAKALAAMPAPLRAIGTFAGLGWYEEDCDWCLVALAFPQHFYEYKQLCAVGTALGCNDLARLWLATDPQGAAYLARVEAYRKEHGAQFSIGSYGTGQGKMWWAKAKNLAGTERIEFKISSDDLYRLRSPFADTDIAAQGGTITKREAIPSKDPLDGHLSSLTDIPGATEALYRAGAS